MACFKRSVPRMAFGACLALLAWPAFGAAPLEHVGMCDASAAIAVSGDRFLVANDEDNLLRVYSSGSAGPALTKIDLPALLTTAGDAGAGEFDLEGAARIGQRIYWIASHGSNKKGKSRPERQQLFATDLAGGGGEVSLTAAGRPYAGLLAAMEREPALKKYGLLEASTKPPEKKNGLNIEGLAATPEGALLIGFRNPVPQGMALLVPLLNPDPVLTAGAGQVWPQEPRFGPPIELALGGLGIRSIDYAQGLRAYLIVAGPAGTKGQFKLFKWAGPGKAAPALLPIDISPGDLRPEAMFALDDGRSFQILSDDGEIKMGKVACKDLRDLGRAGEQKFRSIVIRP